MPCRRPMRQPAPAARRKCPAGFPARPARAKRRVPSMSPLGFGMGLRRRFTIVVMNLHRIRGRTTLTWDQVRVTLWRRAKHAGLKRGDVLAHRREEALGID